MVCIIIADIKSGSCMITNVTGKLFMNVRAWTQQNHIPTYEDAEPFLMYIDKYVKLAVGGHYINKWVK
jgi:hypothetical protein